MDTLDDQERDAHNKAVAKESSWLCSLFQESEISLITKRKIIKELMKQHKKEKEVNHAT